MRVNLSAITAYISQNKLTKEQVAETLKRKEKYTVFCDVNISELDLSDMDLKGVFFINVAMDKTVFKNADLSSAGFYHCYVSKADFTDADLRSAEFFYGSVTHSDFERAKLDAVEFNSVAFWCNTVKNASIKGAGFIFTDLADCSFENADLQKADLLTAHFDYTSFCGANCRDARFAYEPRSDYADFKGADLTGAVMVKCEDVPVAQAIAAKEDNDDKQT